MTQLVVRPVWQSVVSCIQTFNRLSNTFDNWFYNRLYHVYSRLSNRLYNPVWQPCWTNSHCSFNRLSNLDSRLYRVNKHPNGWQTGLTIGWMFVYMIQPVVQPVVSCKRGIRLLCIFNYLDRVWKATRSLNLLTKEADLRNLRCVRRLSITSCWTAGSDCKLCIKYSFGIITY